MIPPPPAGARRLFPGHAPDLLAGALAGTAGAPGAGPGARGLVIGRLLEDGDGADLAWLAAGLGEAELAAWFARCGGRALSRRSRAFWSRVLDVAPPAPAHLAEVLWPL